MKIVFTGYYGFSNFGDDLFPLACLETIKDKSNVKVSILSPRIEGVEADFIIPDFLSKVYQSSGFFGQVFRFFSMVYAAIVYDKLILAGGSVLSSNTSLRMRKLQYYLAKFNVVKMYAIGVSVGPFNSQRDRLFFRKFIDELQFLGARDIKSMDELKSLGVSSRSNLVNDMAGLLYPLIRKLKNARSDDSSSKLTISLCNYETYISGDVEVERKRNRALLEGVLKFCKQNDIYCVDILVLNSNNFIGDKMLSLECSEHLESNGISSRLMYHHSPIETVSIIARSQLFLTTRLHGGIIAYLSGVSFCLVEYHEKCRDFNDLIGMDSSVRLTNENISTTRVDNILSGLQQRNGSFSIYPSEYSRTCAYLKGIFE